MRLFALIALTVALGSCSMLNSRELATNDGKSSDVMKGSPCACVKLEWQNKGFDQWHS